MFFIFFLEKWLRITRNVLKFLENEMVFEEKLKKVEKKLEKRRFLRKSQKKVVGLKPRGVWNSVRKKVILPKC